MSAETLRAKAQALEAVRKRHALLLAAQKALDDAVAEARRADCYWVEIGEAVGMSRQGVALRYAARMERAS